MNAKNLIFQFSVNNFDYFLTITGKNTQYYKAKNSNSQRVSFVRINRFEYIEALEIVNNSKQEDKKKDVLISEHTLKEDVEDTPREEEENAQEEQKEEGFLTKKWI